MCTREGCCNNVVKSEYGGKGVKRNSSGSCCRCKDVPKKPNSTPGLYDYVTFNNFKELKELYGMLKKGQWCKFIILTFITVLYFSLVVSFYNLTLKNLRIIFAIDEPSGSKRINLWAIFWAAFWKCY
uniref:Uncharacterized protein n=1 Tax=Cacopsylla melanoneura TaxID=428564 RepID=A0A8D8PQV1_9HEMI